MFLRIKGLALYGAWLYAMARPLHCGVLKYPSMIRAVRDCSLRSEAMAKHHDVNARAWKVEHTNNTIMFQIIDLSKNDGEIKNHACVPTY